MMSGATLGFGYKTFIEGDVLMYEMANTKKLKALGEGAPGAMDAFWAFDKAAMADGVIPKKYKELIALGVALTTQCPYCLEIHRAGAVKAGATQQEIAEAALVAAALRAGAAVTHATHLVGEGTGK
ncbi:MAG TPA: carboxymuconolactone decarboxylase family protein [Edaphobacter sp.]|jgi:AhpD family alkylhydroperoxidase|nr:carboxymuconolactone decarboxylase family protein [Edaphobacter sp.]